MDASGNNRYELLFMDDEGAPSAPAIIAPPKKKEATPSVSSATAAKTSQAANKNAKKSSTNAEKENKAGTLNKNESGKKSTGVVAANHSRTTLKQDVNADGNRNRNRANNFGESSEGNNRNVAFKSQNNNRRNVREGGEGRGTGFGNAVGGEFNNDQQRPRVGHNRDRDRDNRGPPRSNRFGENSFRGKREFDRQSGSDKTGVKAVDKRDGAGAHNWGSVKQEIEEINKSSTDAETSLTDKEDSPNEQSTDQVPVPEEEETKEMTLDEYKAMRQQRTKPQFNLRKAGEGEDATQWNKMVVLNKKKEGGESEEEFEYDPSLYPQRVGRLQRIVDIQFNFNDSRRSNGGIGGFGRGRGRGPRPGGGGGAGGGSGAGGGGGAGADKGRFDGAPRGGNTFGDAARGNSGKPRNFGERTRGGGPSALKVDDERQFPTLS